MINVTKLNSQILSLSNEIFVRTKNVYLINYYLLKSDYSYSYPLHSL